MTKIELFVGAPNPVRHTFDDPHKWEGVKSQILNVMNMGKGTFSVPLDDGAATTYVYSPTLHIAWVGTE